MPFDAVKMDTLRTNHAISSTGYSTDVVTDCGQKSKQLLNSAPDFSRMYTVNQVPLSTRVVVVVLF